MQATHTPGPWAVDDTAQPAHMAQCLIGNPTWIAIEDSADDGGHVAYCAPDNAPIIAAAPAMLAALQMALTALERSGKERGTRHLEAVAVRDAIALATGER